jgi:hypothetical protein
MHSNSHRHTGLSVFIIIITLALQLPVVADNLADDDAPVSILYYESIQLITPPDNGKYNATPAAVETQATLRFDAYGRRFELQIDSASAVSGTNFTQWRGQLPGLPGSWFQLLQDNEELSGIIADGTDTYFIEPRRRVTDLLLEAPADYAPTNVIFRLADTLVPQGLMACSTIDAASTADGLVDGQTAFAKLNAELQTASGITLHSDSPRLLVGVVADESFLNEYAGQAENEIALIFNTVQGIYANEFGIELDVDTVFSVTPEVTSPFSATDVAGKLLTELADWRNHNQRHLGHTHLLTRKNLVNASGDRLAGISYLAEPGGSGICNPITGASLSRDISGLTALIVAHELGHNMGAPHDGDPSSTCSATPDSQFIMSSSISYRTSLSFSNCSTEQMDRIIASAACLSRTTQTQSVSTSEDGSGGGGALGWLSIPGLLISILLRRRRQRTLLS